MESPHWQRLGAWWLNRAGRSFDSLAQAISVCNGLLFRYHRARVVDAYGRESYSV